MQKKQIRSGTHALLTEALWLIALLLAMLGRPDSLVAAHGQSLDGELKYPPDFKHFDYVSPHAKKGGALVMHSLGSFDKMNPFTLKGESPDGLGLYVFETLMVPSLDEPFAQYGLLAEDIVVAEDKRSITFTLHKNARFSDGTPVTAEDVRFSLETLKSEDAHPFYQVYFHDIEGAEVLDPWTVKLYCKHDNREIHMIAGQLPVLSKRFFSRHPFHSHGGRDALVLPVGSGPYVVQSFDLGKTIVYAKNPDYWGRDLPVRRGMFNFDTLTIKSFKDQTVSVEAFKAGEFDLMPVNIAKQWQRDMAGRRFDQGILTKKAFPHKNNAGMQGFVFNTRLELFQDRRVRQAVGLAFNFERTNATLFFNQYTRNTSYFSNSELAAQGLPSQAELRLLEPFRDQVPAEVFTEPLTPPSTDGPGGIRANLRKAMQLLNEAGWRIEDGVLVNEVGRRFSFEILLASPSFERVMAGFTQNLRTLGVQATYRTLDLALYAERVKSFDFDMIVATFGQSQSPGNEQREYWTGKAARRTGSRNFAGVNDPVVDALVEAVIYAQDRDALVTACRALDRVLWYGYYVVPNWYLASHRLAFSTSLRYPATLPVYYGIDQFVQTWWRE
ncbi:MAG: ABC transporter substrate-binding protein [Desulfobulbus propionicus]|nr:MAG: ABC transporter substrate-binding protein [Desulfobulbus propionicus]